MIKTMNFLFSPYFKNISTYYSPFKVLSQNSNGQSDYLNHNFRIRLAAITQFKNGWDTGLRVGSSWPERKWRRSLYTTKQTCYFLMHSDRCWGSQDSFLPLWVAVCVVGTVLFKITAKKASNRKFPFTVHRRVVAFILTLFSLGGGGGGAHYARADINEL